jgi:divalent metal cation (Fe/Co/Zn/Cd) transporter
MSAAAIALGAPVVDPIIGLVITLMILHIIRESWNAIRAPHHHDHRVNDHSPPAASRRTTPREP